ncbi:MAG TPA: carbamoyl phosphate synthase small subunit [Clostridia bacterium]|nr:carbamoyl phosphate synthase small subunit [Clostridia bacterium]
MAYLVLEDGSVYEGSPRGAFRETACEIVFNTSMAGYVEVLTDPSYAGQGVVMTYPLIGNYGVSREDFESDRLQPCAFIVHELCETPSNFRNEMPLEQLLIEHNIPCLVDVDTRSIVKKLRDKGSMRGVITQDISNINRCLNIIKEFKHDRLVESVSVEHSCLLGSENTGHNIALLDFGVMNSVENSLLTRNCRVTRLPCLTSASEIIGGGFDGLVLTGGPGNPADCKEIIENIKQLYDYGIPTFAISLGHQLTALAVGGKTTKMNHPHRGGNHPVKFLKQDKTFLTSQNHGYMVCSEGLPSNAEVFCINVNDKTVEGVLYHGKPWFTVQFCPEVKPAPHNTSFLFDRFLKTIEEGRYCD